MEIITSTHTLFLLYGLSVPHLTDFRRWGVRPLCGETTVYHVPIYERQPCTLASISLCSLIAHAFRSPPLHRLSPAFPFLTYRAVNADKRYPLPRLLPSVSESKNSVNTLFVVAKIGKYPQTSKYFGTNLLFSSTKPIKATAITVTRIYFSALIPRMTDHISFSFFII